MRFVHSRAVHRSVSSPIIDGLHAIVSRPPNTSPDPRKAQRESSIDTRKSSKEQHLGAK